MERIRSTKRAGTGMADPPGELMVTGSPASLASVLSDVAHLLVQEGSPSKVLDAVADALSELVPHDALTLYQADLSLRQIRPVLIRDPYYADQMLAIGPVAYGRGITGTVAETRTPQLVNDVHLDPRAVQVPDTPAGEPESLVAVPMLARDELKGVLCLYRRGEGSHFSVREFELAILFSDLAALAIDNAQIRTRLESEVITDHLTALHNHRYFHERLGEECRRASRARSSVSLLIYDIDDFKRSNDTYGHLAGDQILQGVASLSRECCRSEDVLCRIGGEEFAVILPGATLAEARVAAERIRGAIEGTVFLADERITVSVGVAEGPLHASSPRELMTCADLALLEAKSCGKNQVRVYAPLDQEDSDGAPSSTDAQAATTESRQPAGRGGTQARLAAFGARGELRSAAQLRMLQSLSAKLNRLNDVRQIGHSVTAELRTLIDYHTCRVYLLQPDGQTLVPIAFRGAASQYAGETYEGLIVKRGEGVTGHVAETGEPWYAPDANQDPHAVDIPGTPLLEESLLAVPMIYNDRVIGVVVLAKLGIDQFDAEDISLLQALAASAAIAIENARLLQLEREAAEESTALLRLSQALTNVSDVAGVLEESLRAIPSMLRCAEVSAWIRDPRTGAIHLMKHRGWDERLAARLDQHAIPAEAAERFRISVDKVFVLPAEVVAQLPIEYRVLEDARETLVAPIRWEPDGQGAIVAVAPDLASRFSEDDIRFAQGIADITSLALGNARRFDDLERAYVSTVEALANALEAQDEYTSDHAHALAEMTLAVGTNLGLDADRLKTLELGALFHDIGKIGVPSEIIRKPGPLTAAERREMNRHPEIGEQILAPVPFLQPIRPIVRACHERWDGGGYPDGLAGEDIPLEARIIFVCDAFHAMTSDRPYRKALPEGEAIRRLHLASGKQFDPTIVEMFVSIRRAGTFHLHQHV